MRELLDDIMKFLLIFLGPVMVLYRRTPYFYTMHAHVFRGDLLPTGSAEKLCVCACVCKFTRMHR